MGYHRRFGSTTQARGGHLREYAAQTSRDALLRSGVVWAMAVSDLNLAAVIDDHFAGWSPQMPLVDALARVGNCAHPIRLRGSSMRIDTATGEILSNYAGSDDPLGVTYTSALTGGLRCARPVRGCTQQTWSTSTSGLLGLGRSGGSGRRMGCLRPRLSVRRGRAGAGGGQVGRHDQGRSGRVPGQAGDHDQREPGGGRQGCDRHPRRRPGDHGRHVRCRDRADCL
jgi:hypothetical protein